MNIRVLLCTAGIAAVQVLSAIELTADSNRLEAGEAFVKWLVEYQEPGRAGTKCRWDFRGMQILSEELPVEYFIPDSSHMDILCGREGRNRYYYRQGSDACGVWDMRMRLSISIMLVPNFCCVILSLMAIL